ncbi:LysM peptidoglycan-binding domain-containing protein [Allobacillus sp. GCM10007491]|uniref:Glycoside hydrolase family 18 protein n=1 Tax=Allobacillus saliphilus TaxID=2912308 RepID=A0A941CUM2_9BACI|nr:glycoside hydrolase family 18 protein [Allobacillus saliphilus]MBR7554267.1 glycoside hydrolase family 18 protein [Allobacillus saliphilus]
MIIHTVSRGDSVYLLSQRYQTAVDLIVQANELDQPEDLVVGQALVIPIDSYTVQPGESLYLIAQKLNTTYQTLAAYNDLSLEAPLLIGQVLAVPKPAERPIVSNAYIEPSGGVVSERLQQSARSKSPYLTYLAPFTYRVNRDGTLNPPPLDDFPAIAEANGAALMMVITNLEEGAFSEELGRLILTDNTVQTTLLDEIIQTATAMNYRDVHFDFEFLPAELKESYNDFLRRAKQRLQANDLLLSTALAPKNRADQPGQWYAAHDYKAHGEIADMVVLMTYEWGYSGGPPMAVSPIGPVRAVVEYALTEMPAEKILLGQNLYGYDWTLPYEPGGEYARALSPNQAIQLARSMNQAIQYDEEPQAPFFTYWDAEGNQHEVWFEDARSIQAKFDLIRELNLRGISYWKLGLAFPQNWLLLQDQFAIVKNV